MNSTIDTTGTYGETGPPLSPGASKGIIGMLMGVCTLFTLFRIGTRMFIHREVWWDDFTTGVAWAGSIALGVLQFVYLNGEADVDGMTPKEHDRFETGFLSTQITVRGSLLFARLSILLLYLRVFFPARASKNFFWWAIWGTTGLNILYSVVHILVLTLQCVESHESWGNVCIHESKLLIAASVINTISDIAVIVIPLGAIRKIQLSWEKKCGLVSLFGFGALAPVASIARLVYQAKNFDTDAEAGTYSITILLANAELAIAIISGCVPVLGILCTQRRRQHRPARDRRHQLSSPEPRFSEDSEPGGQPQPRSPAFVPMGWAGDISRPVGAAARRISRIEVWWWSKERTAAPEAIELAAL